jgi:hypothetical protein
MATNITLEVSLESILGGASLQGYVDVVLCNFGTVPPAVAGVGMLADAGIPQLEGPASSFTFNLYGNDQITPSGSFYAITIYDENKQPVQTGNYILTGTATLQLSNLTPIVEPPPNSPSNYIINNNASGALTINVAGYSGPVVIDLTLTGNLVLTLSGFTRGQLIQFIIQQNGIGGYGITWPANVINPAAIDPTANSITTQNFVVSANGNIYPALGWS